MFDKKKGGRGCGSEQTPLTYIGFTAWLEHCLVPSGPKCVSAWTDHVNKQTLDKMKVHGAQGIQSILKNRLYIIVLTISNSSPPLSFLHQKTVTVFFVCLFVLFFIYKYIASKPILFSCP